MPFLQQLDRSIRISYFYFIMWMILKGFLGLALMAGAIDAFHPEFMGIIIPLTGFCWGLGLVLNMLTDILNGIARFIIAMRQ